MRRESEELVACWTLVEADRELIANKTGATRLGFVLMLKFFTDHPSRPSEPSAR